MSLNDTDNVVQLRHPAVICDIGAKAPGLAAGPRRRPQRGTLIHFPVRESAALSSGPAQPAATGAMEPVMPAASARSPSGSPARSAPTRERVAQAAIRTTTTGTDTQQREAIERGENEGMRVAPV